MNAVMTAEYVVILRDSVSDVEEEINTQAKQGYRLVSFETNPENKWEEGSYTAVMVREPAPTPTTDQTTTLHKRITLLEERLAKFERQTMRIEELEKQVNDITDKIDWSK